MIDAITSLAFSIYENKGVYCLLLGSGISRSADIPTGWEITLDLVRRIAALQGETSQPDWVKWYAAKFGTQPAYSELLDQLACTSDERRSILHGYIEPDADEIAAGKKLPTAAHLAIARLVATGYVRVIITTNFDRLLENALRESGVEPTVISSDDALQGAVPLIHSRCYVIKIHGDYLDTRIRNTDSELGAYTSALNTLLDRIIDEHGLIVCGWSGDWDPALRAAITRAPNRRYPMFWATRGQMSPVAETLVQQRAGKLIEIDGADAFFQKLESLVSVQAQAQRPNPRSVEIIVASAKKYLVRPEFRIQLDELVGGEVRQIDKRVSASNVNPAAWSNDHFVSAVASYESLTEILARVFGVMGRYGAGGEAGGVRDIIAKLGFREAISGFGPLANLRTYPAVLLFYAYGLGLLKAQRFGDLFRLFSTSIKTDRPHAQTVVSYLFLTRWEGNTQDPWKMLPGLDRRQAALSEHLHDVLSKWTVDYLFTAGEFTYLHTHFELLGTLAYLTLTSTEAMLQAAVDGSGQGYVRAPIGRAGWDGRISRAIFDSWKGDLELQLLKAGFADGDENFVTLAIRSICEQSSIGNY